RLEADKADAPLLLANGNPVDSGDLAGTNRHFAVWHDPFPKPAYLFALVAGDLAQIGDTFTTMSGRTVDLRIYVEHGKQDRAAYAMDALKRSMAWDETVYGCEYDLDIFMIVAVSDFNMGAMENKGLNIFNDKYVLADPETATDQDYAHVEGVIAHEYFHNWTGNRITCRDWFQLCLKEGLTVFRDQEFSSDERSRPVKRITDVRLLKAHQFPEDSGPLAHPVRPTEYSEINNFYTATVYEKGAEVVRMLNTLLGDSGFRAGMDLYLSRHDGDAATIEDFLSCFSEATDTDLTQFALWYSQSGTPRVIARHRREDDGTTLLTLQQSCPSTPGQSAKQPFVVPLAYAWIDKDGNQLSRTPDPANGGTDTLLVLRNETEHFRFTGLPADSVLSLNRTFSAPVNLDTGQSLDDLAFLARFDTDPFNRWQALQHLFQAVLSDGVATCRQGDPFPDTESVIAAARAVLSDSDLDPAFKALALTLPSEAEIAREIGTDIDTDSVHAARTRLKVDIGKALSDGIDTYAESLEPTSGSYDPGAAAAGKRALVNILHDYRAAGGRDDAASLLLARFRSATNMTDRHAALISLVQAGFSDAETALYEFYDRYNGDALVLDKWFFAQATAPGPNTLERVRSLMNHDRFTLSNPNRTRSLIGAFAAANQAQFNRADGAGYRFVGEICAKLDDTNPQVAARILSAFRSWRSLEPGRRLHARAALETLSDKPPSSPDVADIVKRCLA
ncbi:MAG: aminopeptidase N, partial [Pseudomonadota bacterium]